MIDSLDSLDSLEEGAFCETTQRVIIISPFPAAVRSLVMALTIRCFDVLVFHNENDPMLASIEADLMIVDRTKSAAGEVKRPPLAAAATLLYLVNSGFDAAAAEGEALPWPCPAETALAKIMEMANRNNNSSTAALSATGQLKYKEAVLDVRRFTAHKAGMKLELTRTEFDVFKALLSAGGAVLTRQEIMEQVWGENYFGGSNSVDVHIKSLRQKLNDDPKNPEYIATVRGIGYRIAD